jgi:hypothetical protein
VWKIFILSLQQIMFIHFAAKGVRRRQKDLFHTVELQIESEQFLVYELASHEPAIYWIIYPNSLSSNLCLVRGFQTL